MDNARMLILDSMSLFFKVFSESHLFCSIWCNMQQETRFDLHMQSCLIAYFLIKHPLPLHFQMVTIFQWIEIGCSDWTQYLYLFKLFQNPSHFAQLRVTTHPNTPGLRSWIPAIHDLSTMAS